MKLRFAFRMIVSAVLTCLWVTPVLSANGMAEVPFRFYTVLDGLTQSQVVDIEQDHAGYLWFTTARGLNRFDGKDFDQYTIADGLPHNSLTALHVSDSNSIWVGDARGGITVIRGARVAHTIEPFAGKVKPILDIEFVGDRKFAVVANVGIIEIVAGTENFSVQHLVGDAATGITNLSVHGTDVWVESATGLYRLIYDGEPSLRLLSDTIRKVHADPAGTLWAADKNGAVGRWASGEFQSIAQLDAADEIVSIQTDKDEAVWIATSNELFKLDGGEMNAGDRSGELRRYAGIDDVTSMFIDKENSLWLSSGSRLIRFLGERFRHYRLRTGFDAETVWAISEDRHGRYWFGTESKLLMLGKDDSLIVVDERYGIPEGTVRDIVADGNGILWIGITDNGLYQFDVDKMRATHVAKSGNAKVLDVAVAGNGAVWYTTLDQGVFQYVPEAGSLRRFPTPNDTSVYSLDISSDGSVWYGADETGLVKLATGSSGGLRPADLWCARPASLTAA